ncbi:hypothetical protein ACO0K2_13070 [Undibacterium sp. MH2W]|uniref:hypothetical protein n=1 Tax=Undibacterium sp. MH2W TaxID=3413044 RepID=UPI003BF448C9
MENKKKDGRPGRTLLETMQTKAWLTYILKSKNATNISELDRLVFKVAANTAISRAKLDGDIPDIRWDKYQNHGKSPDETRLNLVDTPDRVPGSKPVFQSGLYEKNELIPVWRLFEINPNFRSHESDHLWVMVDAICGEMQNFRDCGAPYSIRVSSLANLFVPKAEWEQLEFSKPECNPTVNAIKKAYTDGYFQPSLKLLAGAMAMWRIAMDVGESMAQMEYLVKGLLLCEPCIQALKSHNIYDEFLEAINIIEINDCIRRGDLETAKKITKHLLGKAD